MEEEEPYKGELMGEESSDLDGERLRWGLVGELPRRGLVEE